MIAIGVLVKGETMHFEYISQHVSEGLMRVSLDTGVPVIFGVLTVLDDGQARAGLVSRRAATITARTGAWLLWRWVFKRKMWAAGKLE